MPKFMVKNKYTYEKVRQTDYRYAPACWAMSQNHVEGRFIYEGAEALYSGVIVTGAAPVEILLTKEQGARFAAVSGLQVAQRTGEGLLCRVTLWGDKGESFMSVVYMTEAARLLSTAKMDFVPVRMTVETRAYAPVWDVPEMEIAISYGYVLNTLGEVGGQAHFYEAENASLADDRGAMVWTLEGEGRLTSPVFPDSSDTVYNMKMPRRNTVMLVITNRSTAKLLTLTFATTTHPWGNNGAIGLELAQDGEPHAYYFNLSALPQYCDGRMAQFTLCAEGEGDIIIHRYTFEQEKPIREVGCTVTACTADPVGETVTVTGTLLGTETLSKMAEAGGVLSVYVTTMADEQDTPAGKRKLATIVLPKGGAGEFVIDNIPLRDEYTTLLPYQFAIFAEAEGQAPVWLCDRFYIENYEDFDKNPYTFELPDYTVSVLDFGAKGDAIHDDTKAIQAAIDHVAEAGGGQIVLPGSDDFYGRRYIITSLLLPSYIDLHFEAGAVLWQSQLKDDYDYEVTYGHDGVIPGVNWTHCLHVCNLPLIQAANIHHTRITGKGTIRMMDTGSEEGVGMPGYATGCPDRIHCIPLGFFRVDHCEWKDFEIIRSNNYHTDYYHASYCYAGNLRLHEVKCVSGDGFGVGGSHHILVNRCFFQSNDDGIVMACHMYDPRGILWWTNMVDEDGCCDHIKTVHSYLNSGGGKALAFIPWGTSDHNQSRQEIKNIEAYDNYLTSVNPVGTWPDNPYNGKQPFDNTETDDYSPVKNVRIFRNRYAGNCTLGPIACTNVLTDCGVHSTSQFRNGDFSLGGMANWTEFPNSDPESVHAVIYADKEKGCIECFDKGEVAAAQGLHLLCGTHTAEMELLTGRDGATVYAARITDGEVLAEKTFVCLRPTVVSVTFAVDADEDDVFIGVRSVGCDPLGYAVFDQCVLHSVVDEEGLMRRRAEAYMAAIRREFDPADVFTAHAENGKMILSGGTAPAESAEADTAYLPVLEVQDAFAIEAAVRADDYDPAHGAYGFGYRFSISEDGTCYRELRFNASKQTLTLMEITPDGERELYRRTHFFFTSNDFHIFRIEVGTDEVAVWIDGAQYAVIPCPIVAGRVAFFMTDARVSLCNLKLK